MTSSDLFVFLIWMTQDRCCIEDKNVYRSQAIESILVGILGIWPQLGPGLIAPLESEGSIDILFYFTASDDPSVRHKYLIWFNLLKMNRRVFSAPCFHEISLQIFWLLLLRISLSFASVSCFWLADLNLAEQDPTRLHQWKRPVVITHKSQFCVCT